MSFDRGGVPDERILCVVKSEASPMKSLKIKVHRSLLHRAVSVGRPRGKDTDILFYIVIEIQNLRDDKLK